MIGNLNFSILAALLFLVVIIDLFLVKESSTTNKTNYMPKFNAKKNREHVHGFFK